MPIEVRNDAAPRVVGPYAYQTGISQFLAEQRAIQQQREDMQAQMAQRERLAGAGIAADERRMAYGHASDMQRMAFGAGLDEQKMVKGAELEGLARDAEFKRQAEIAAMNARAEGAAADAARRAKLRDAALGIGAPMLKTQILPPAEYKLRVGNLRKQIAALDAQKATMDPDEHAAGVAGFQRQIDSMVPEQKPPTTRADLERDVITDDEGQRWQKDPETGKWEVPRGFTKPLSPQERKDKDWEQFLNWQKNTAVTVETKRKINGKTVPEKKTILKSYADYLAERANADAHNDQQIAREKVRAQQEEAAKGGGIPGRTLPGAGVMLPQSGDIRMQEEGMLPEDMLAPPGGAPGAPTEADPFSPGWGANPPVEVPLDDPTAPTPAGPAGSNFVPLDGTQAGGPTGGPPTSAVPPTSQTLTDTGGQPPTTAPAPGSAAPAPQFVQPLGFEFNPTAAPSKEEAIHNQQVAEQLLAPENIAAMPDDALANTLQSLEAENGYQAMGLPKKTAEKVRQAVGGEIAKRENIQKANSYLDGAETGMIRTVTDETLAKAEKNLDTAPIPDDLRAQTKAAIVAEKARRKKNQEAVEAGTTIPVPDVHEQQAAQDTEERRAIMADMAEREEIRAKALPPPTPRSANPAAVRYREYLSKKLARLPVIRSPEELAGLPSGTMYINPDGKQVAHIDLSKSLRGEGYIDPKGAMPSGDQLLSVLMKLPLATTPAQVAAIKPGQIYRTSSNVKQRNAIQVKALDLEQETE